MSDQNEVQPNEVKNVKVPGTISVTYATEAEVIKEGDKIVSAKPKTRQTVNVPFNHEAAFDVLSADVQRRFGLKEFKTTAQDYARGLMSVKPIGDEITDIPTVSQKLAEKDWTTAERGSRLTGSRKVAAELAKGLKAAAGTLTAEQEADAQTKLNELMAMLGIKK